MTTDQHDTTPSDEDPTGGPTADPGSELFDKDADIDDDRQDAPRADKTGDDEPELDGFRATPGDGNQDQ